MTFFLIKLTCKVLGHKWKPFSIQGDRYRYCARCGRITDSLTDKENLIKGRYIKNG